MLKLEGVTSKYGAVTALRDVSIEIGDGEFVSIIGVNGAGKSTTLRTITGIMHPSAGTVTFNGKRIDRMAPNKIVAEGIAMCPEGRQVFPTLTVNQNLDMGGFLIRKNQTLFKELKEMVIELFPRLAERINQPAGTLSGGEQQMLAVGRALMSQPKLLLLDEPSLGLSPKLSEEMFQFIYKIHETKGLTILLVEQMANLALSMSDRAYVLESGAVALTGTGKELLDNEHVMNVYLGTH